jgi:hypothetical protein
LIKYICKIIPDKTASLRKLEQGHWEIIDQKSRDRLYDLIYNLVHNPQVINRYVISDSIYGAAEKLADILREIKFPYYSRILQDMGEISTFINSMYFIKSDPKSVERCYQKLSKIKKELCISSPDDCNDDHKDS